MVAKYRSAVAAAAKCSPTLAMVLNTGAKTHQKL
jgi:hypothetical protein